MKDYNASLEYDNPDTPKGGKHTVTLGIIVRATEIAEAIETALALAKESLREAGIKARELEVTGIKLTHGYAWPNEIAGTIQEVKSNEPTSEDDSCSGITQRSY